MDVLAAVSLVGNIIQFVDFSTKLLSKSTELYRSSDGALAVNVDIETATNDLVLLNGKLKGVATNIGDPSLQSLCKSCDSVADELFAALNQLKIQAKQHKWKSFRNAFLCVWSREKIQELDRRLARFRDELSLHMTVELWEQISQLKSEQLCHLKNQDATAGKILGAIIQQEKLFRHAELQREKQEMSLATKIRSQADQIGIRLSQRLDLVEATIASVQSSQNRLEQSMSTQISDVQNWKYQPLTTSDRNPRRYSELDPESSVGIDAHPCDCSVTYSRYMGIFSGLFRVRISSEHIPACTYYKRSRHIEMSAAFQLPQLWKTLNMSFTASRNAGGYSLIPSISVTRVVDRRTNPAFLLFHSIQKNCAKEIIIPDFPRHSPKKLYHLWEAKGNHSYFQFQWDSIALDKALSEALQQIRVLFATGQSSALDTDVNGNTLLHEIVQLGIRVEETSENTKLLFRTLLRYIISAGAVKDAEARAPQCTRNYSREDGLWVVAPMSKFASVQLLGSDLISSRTPRDIAIWDSQMRHRISDDHSGIDMDRLFVELDFDSSDGMPRLLEARDSLTFADYVRNRPDIAIDLGYGELALAVIKRDQSKLCHLLNRGFDPDDSRPWTYATRWWHHSKLEELRRFPALSISLGWSDGVEALLKAGSNPLLAFVGVSRLHSGNKQSVLALLRSDIPLSIVISHGHRYPTFGLRTAAAIIMLGDLDDDTKMAMLEKLVSQRRELRRLALNILNESEKISFNLKNEDGELPDLHAASISIAIAQKGVRLPLAIAVSHEYFPKRDNFTCSGPYTPVYHLACGQMKPKFAEFLFKSGFKDIDISAFSQTLSLSTTPLWASCTLRNFEMANWFIKRGACPVFSIDGVKNSALSALGVLFRRVMTFASLEGVDRAESNHPPTTPEDFLERLDNSRLIPKLLESGRVGFEDCCPCFCSVDCYTDISAWMRPGSDNIDFPTKMELMEQWIGLLHAPTDIREYWRTFFRAETFERLGLVHTCHYWKYGCTAHHFRDENERVELRDEDIKAGLVADLESWMEKYNATEKSCIESGGSLKTFVALWTKKLNQELFENETHRGLAVEADVDFNPAAYTVGLKAVGLDDFPWV